MGCDHRFSNSGDPLVFPEINLCMPPSSTLELNAKNFDLFAAKHYNNPHCLDPDEFTEDLLKFKYVKKLLTRYRDSQDLQERLILNHLIVIYNIFDIAAANKMMFFRVNENLWPALKTFLLFLNHLPENYLPDVPIDLFVVKKLKSL